MLPLLKLQEADNQHEQTVRAEATIPRRVQPVDLQQLLEDEHQRLQHRVLLLVRCHHLNNFVPGVLHVVNGVAVVDNVADVDQEIRFIHAQVLLFDRDAFLFRQLDERAGKENDWPTSINVIQTLEPWRLVAVLLGLQLVLDVLQGRRVESVAEIFVRWHP